MNVTIYLNAEQVSQIDQYIASRVAAVPELGMYLKPAGVAKQALFIGLSHMLDVAKNSQNLPLPLSSSPAERDAAQAAAPGAGGKNKKASA